MKIDKSPIKDWFGYSRQERRATTILMIILLIIIGVRYTIPEKDRSLDYVVFEYPDENIPGSNSTSLRAKKLDLNNITYDTLLKNGIVSSETATNLRYNEIDRKFRSGYNSNPQQRDNKKAFVKYHSDDTIVRSKPYHQKPRLEINSCDSESFVGLPGIGPVLSARIIKYRRLLGGFARIDQLKEVYGLPVETYDLIKSRFIVDTLAIKKINVNSAEYKELSRLPYFEKYEVTAILKFRKLKGRIVGIADLIDNKLITKEKAQKVGAYLRFE